MSTDVYALQLLPEIQPTAGFDGGSDGDLRIKTCWEPTCIITYCSNPMTVIG